MADDLAEHRPLADAFSAHGPDPGSHPLPPGAPLRPPMPAEVVDEHFARRPAELPPLVLPPPPKEQGSGAFWAAIVVVLAAIGGIGVWIYQTQDFSFSAGEPQRASSPVGSVPEAAAPATVPSTTAPPTTTTAPVATAPPIPARVMIPGQPLLAWDAGWPEPLGVYRYSVAYYEAPRLDAPHVQYRVEYAHETDELALATLDQNGDQLRREFYLGDWVHRRSGPDQYVRAPRSAESLDASRDHRLARSFNQTHVVPNPAVGFTTVAGGFTDELFGETVTYTLFDLDSAGFANDHPAKFEEWIVRWRRNDVVDPARFDDGVQVASVPEFDHASAVTDPNMDTLRQIASDVIRPDGATVLMGLRSDGRLASLIIHDPLHDLFTMYLLSSNAEYQTLSVPGLDSLAEATWADAG